VLATRHFLSLRQLHRDFYNITGHSVGEYIRLRRISNACAKIKASDLPLDFIANESGYETQQAFHKQFKSVVGMTPLDYKKSDSYFCFYPCGADEIPIAVCVGAESIPAWEVKLIYDSCLIGIEDRALATLENISRRVFGRSGKQKGSQLCYELMTEQDSAGKSVFCATATVKYDEEAINNAWNYLYNIWLPSSMFEQTEDKYFEEYLFRNGKPYRLRLYLPVQKRKNARHIVMCEQPQSSYIIAETSGADAEHKASERVITYLREHYPLLLQNARRFYVCEDGEKYICGVACGNDFALPKNSGLAVKTLPAGCYAVLSGDCLGDTAVGKAKIEAWLKNNSIAYEDEPILAVYESANGRFDEESVTMTLYKKVKDGKIG
jgi:DNA gyrase inhibitor GyrI